jgi:hypothetical protein
MSVAVCPSTQCNSSEGLNLQKWNSFPVLVAWTKTLQNRYFCKVVNRRGLQPFVAISLRKRPAVALTWCSQKAVKSARCSTIITSLSAEATGRNSRGHLKQILGFSISKFNFLLYAAHSLPFLFPKLTKSTTSFKHIKRQGKGSYGQLRITTRHNFVGAFVMTVIKLQFL